MSFAPIENRKPTPSSKEEPELLGEVVKLINRVDKASLPPELKENTKESLLRLNRSMKFGSYQVEYEKTARYIERVVSLPWNTRSEDKLDLVAAKKILDKNFPPQKRT